MFNALLAKIAAGKLERRQADRVRRRFPVAWLRGGALVAAQGLELSDKDVLFATKEAPPAGGFVDVAMDLDGARVRARLAIARQGLMTQEGTQWTVVAGTFDGIAADDWDKVVRFVRGESEPQNKAHDELAELASKADDGFRLLPLHVQERVVAVLIGAGRLAPESDAKSPLLRLSYDGKTRTGQHRLRVHSRRNSDGDVQLYDSVLLVDDAGNVTLER